MPYKFNESRRHEIQRARYQATNWPEYDAALVRRGGALPSDAIMPRGMPSAKRGKIPTEATHRPHTTSTERFTWTPPWKNKAVFLGLI
jgi:hypothetical protein